jgi:hypothetical protein
MLQGMTVEVLEVAQQEGLGEEFRAAVKVQVAKIRAHPGAWMLIRPGVRKCLGRKFPYDVIYQVMTDKILILALAHKRRKPLYWAGRVGE